MECGIAAEFERGLNEPLRTLRCWESGLLVEAGVMQVTVLAPSENDSTDFSSTQIKCKARPKAQLECVRRVEPPTNRLPESAFGALRPLRESSKFIHVSSAGARRKALLTDLQATITPVEWSLIRFAEPTALQKHAQQKKNNHKSKELQLC